MNISFSLRVDRIQVVIALVMVAFALAMLPAHVRAEEGASSAGLASEAQQILTAINARRAEAGLVALQASPLLNQAAQAHADDVYWNGNYSHWGTDGTFVDDRVARTGYSETPWVSENWVSSRSADTAMNWWMGDYIHRANILTARWREVGVGVAGQAGSGEMVFVAVFSAGDGVDRAEAPVVAASSASSPAIAPAPAAPVAIPETYAVQPGDTLLSIGIRFGMDYMTIAGANGLDYDSVLQIGQILRLPGPGGAASVGIGGPVSDAAIETTGYAIQSGDTLFSIAAHHEISWQDLAGMNGLSEDSLLQIGQEIRVPVDSPSRDGAADFADDALGSDPAYGAPTSAPIEDAIPEYHVVVPGDTVIAVAVQYGLDWDELLALNGLDDESLIQPGDLLRIR